MLCNTMYSSMTSPSTRCSTGNPVALSGMPQHNMVADADPCVLCIAALTRYQPGIAISTEFWPGGSGAAGRAAGAGGLEKVCGGAC